MLNIALIQPRRIAEEWFDDPEVMDDTIAEMLEVRGVNSSEGNGW